jgi:hypothetical protein
MACITDNTGQYIVDYTFANAVTKRIIAMGDEEGVNLCVANFTDFYLVASMVNPTKFRFNVLLFLGSLVGLKYFVV